VQVGQWYPNRRSVLTDRGPGGGTYRAAKPRRDPIDAKHVGESASEGGRCLLAEEARKRRTLGPIESMHSSCR
jgi:hypothetical protein